MGDTPQAADRRHSSPSTPRLLMPTVNSAGTRSRAEIKLRSTPVTRGDPEGVLCAAHSPVEKRSFADTQPASHRSTLRSVENPCRESTTNTSAGPVFSTPCCADTRASRPPSRTPTTRSTRYAAPASPATSCGGCRMERRISGSSPSWHTIPTRIACSVSELDPERNPTVEDPAAIAAKSGRKLWWRCQRCGHEWKTAVSTRTDGCGCPACYRAKRLGE